MLGGRRKRKCLSPYSAEKHVSGAKQARSPAAAKKRTRKMTRKKFETQNAEDCELMGATLTPKSVLLRSGELANACLLFLGKGQKVCIKGSVKIKALTGSAEVFGYVIKAEYKPVELFSPGTSSLVTLSECGKEDSSTTTNVRKTLLDALQNQPSEVIKKALTRAKKASAVLLMRSVQSVEMNFVCSFQSFQDIFSLDLGKDASLDSIEISLKKKTTDLGFILLEPDTARCRVLTVPDQWRAVDDLVGQAEDKTKESTAKAPVVLICGGKDIGKSTFARFLTNSLLNSQEQICFLECDVGQTEFTPPGLISLNKVSSPLLGPPFTHLRQPERSVFFGDVTPKDKPEFYIQCIRNVYQTYANSYKNKVPLIVNTQGWVKGMGVPLLLDVIRLVQPTHIVQFNYATQELANKNLPRITPDFLMETPGWVFAVEEEKMHSKSSRDGILPPESELQNEEGGESTMPFDPVVLQIDTSEPRGDTSVTRFAASDQRTLALLSYFSQTKLNTSAHTASEGLRSCSQTSLLSCVPYTVPWSQVAIHVMHTELPWSQILYSVNASVVALARVSSDQIYHREEENNLPSFLMENPITECIGLGIVRNIDPAKRVLYVLTPLSLDALHQVNTLLKGNLEIPAALFLSTKQVNAPYISSEFSYDLRGAGARKVRYNLLRRKNIQNNI